MRAFAAIMLTLTATCASPHTDNPGTEEAPVDSAVVKLEEPDFAAWPSPFMARKLGLSELEEDVLKMAPVSSLLYRSRFATKPYGYYFQKPAGEAYGVLAVPFTPEPYQASIVKYYVEKYLDEAYFDIRIFNLMENFELNGLGRKEFFVSVKSHGLRLKIAGWHEKFIHIIVYADYDSPAEFIQKAGVFFNPGHPFEHHVSADSEYVNGKATGQFFYECIRHAHFEPYLVGYSVEDGKVIDLTVSVK